MNRRAFCTRFGALFCLMLASASFSAAQDWPQWRGPNRDAKATGFQRAGQLAQGTHEEVAGHCGRWRRHACAGRQQLTSSRGRTTRKSFAASTRRPATKSGKSPTRPKAADRPPAVSPARAARQPWPTERSSRSASAACCAASMPRAATSCGRRTIPRLVSAVLHVQFADRGGWSVHRARRRQSRRRRHRVSTSTTRRRKMAWMESGPCYGSPVLMEVDGTKVVIAPTDDKMVALSAADGKLLWEIPYKQGRYNSATPIVEGTDAHHRRSGHRAHRVQA